MQILSFFFHVYQESQKSHMVQFWFSFLCFLKTLGQKGQENFSKFSFQVI